jgi:hypothetical protein
MIIEIDQITLSHFGSPDPASGGSPPIEKYDGSPLYCHVTRTPGSATTVDILVNTLPPNEAHAIGRIANIYLKYQFREEAPQTLTWSTNLPSGSFAGDLLTPRLSFSADKKRATLVLQQADAAAAAAPASPRMAAAAAAVSDDDDSPYIGLVIVGPELTGAETMGFFVNVPVDDTVDFRSITTARLVWPPPGSTSGPIGSLNVP